MSSVDKASYTFTSLSLNSKVSALESALHQCFSNFKELLHELEIIQSESESFKSKLLTQKEKCENKTCNSSEALKKVIETKDNIINMAASTATKLNESKNFSIVNELFKILCGDVVTLTPPKEADEKIKLESKMSPSYTQKNTPKKELNMSLEGDLFKDESVMEIEGTPGRTSPIIPSKKIKNSSVISKTGTSECREKKKCSDAWPTPELKVMKLDTAKGKSGRVRQSRINFVPIKNTSVVDLTCSPEVTQDGHNVSHVQKLIKKESSENDDTILPSPTSGPGHVILSFPSSRDAKLNKKSVTLSLKKPEPDEPASEIIQVVIPEKKSKENVKIDNFEDSINILKPNRFKSPHKYSPKKTKGKSSPFKMKRSPFKTEPLTIKREISPAKKDCLTPKKDSLQAKPDSTTNKIDFIKMEKIDEDVTHCEESSMSILHHVNKLEVQKSPSKQPLGENKNLMNVPANDGETSMSLLRPEQGQEAAQANADSSTKRNLEKVEPVYKEPTVRKKAEKMALQGWYCDECKEFYGELYADEPEKVKEALERCSKHRGRTNPVRPRTPTGFWDLRWDVPQNTEEFNRRNNAD